MEREYVGIDLHRRRSVIVRMTPEGEKLSSVRINNDPVQLSLAVAQAGPNPEVVIEATYGWYWAADLLQSDGATVHLAHPLGIEGFKNRRLKNDDRDASDLADLLRMGRLPEGWLAPPEVRELRELVRYRAKLVALRSGLKAQIQAVLAKEGVFPDLRELWGPAGSRFLDQVPLAGAYWNRVGSLRDLIVLYDREVAMFERLVHQELKDHAGYQAVQALSGVGRTIGAIFVAEIGDIGRFPSPRHLCSWVGVTPRHRESDAVVHRGAITKMGSKLVRWAALEAVARYHGGPRLSSDFRRIAERRGKNKAKVAVARKLLTLVYYGLRDGEIRCLQDREAA